MYNRALKSTKANGWGFKRFGTSKDRYAGEMIRTPQYTQYIDAMELASEQALHQLSSKERMRLMKSRTAFIYADAWGESSLFENITSALHKATIDTLPKNLVKKFSVKDFTGKVRGERQSLVQAMQLAQDYLNFNVFDFVVICAAYRAVPLLVFTEQDTFDKKRWQRTPPNININFTVERVGCFIFSQHEGEFKVSSGQYALHNEKEIFNGIAFEEDDDLTIQCVTEVRRESIGQGKLIQRNNSIRSINLTNIYGGSGPVTPALSWTYLQQHGRAQEKMRTIVPDNFGGYTYFDTWYQN